jgi:hypothetical protein
MSPSGRSRKRWLGGVVAGLAVAPPASELRISASARRPPDAWRERAILSRGSTKLGISFRPLQAAALGLVRLAAHWRQIEVRPGEWETAELDRQLELVAAAGKQIILAVGAIKNFGYPEFYVSAHHLPDALPEHSLVTCASHPELAAAAQGFVTRLVERYRERKSTVAWQVEHEAVDPLGVEHSWRLGSDLATAEVASVRAADPTRPILMNGVLPTSTPVSWMQRLRTRDQVDSVLVARQRADILGIDYYSRHAVLQAGGLSLYLDGSGRPWRQAGWRQLGRWADRSRGRVMITEGQAEPWEAVAVPPSPTGLVPYSCPPERVIDNYNACLRRAPGVVTLEAYLFWGAEYWLLRKSARDDSYLRAFERLLEES